MRFMIMIYNNPDVWDALTQEEHEAIWAEGSRKWQELKASGEGIIGEPLSPPSESKIVRTSTRGVDITDGPYAESKEQFVGFLLVDVADEARALEIAASWPDARYASVEVRQFGNYNG